MSGNRFCDEKNDWLDSHKENATVEEINKQKRELEELLKPILSKLDDSGNFFLIKVIFSKLFYDLKPRKLLQSIKRRKVEFLEKKYVEIAKKEDTFSFFSFIVYFFFDLSLRYLRFHRYNLKTFMSDHVFKFGE